jgi:DNA-binding NtrC family response regulator
MKNDKNILIIEPDRIAGLELQLQLEKKGFAVQRPISLVDTEAIIAREMPDLVVADTIIAEQTFFERIKKYLRKFHTPFIWVGTFVKREKIIQSEDVNLIGTFSKPFDSSKIVARIVKYFNKNAPFHSRAKA